MIEKEKTQMNMRSRLIAITDLETTGTDPARHEIVEIGLVLIDSDDTSYFGYLGSKSKT